MLTIQRNSFKSTERLDLNFKCPPCVFVYKRFINVVLLDVLFCINQTFNYVSENAVGTYPIMLRYTYGLPATCQV